MSDLPSTDRVSGVLLGLAAGDRNGGPIQLALRLAESLATLGTFDPRDVLARYLAWWREGAFDTGPVAAAVLEQVSRGVPVDEAVARADRERGGFTAGCNPAHRIGPLAMAAWLPDERLPEFAQREARLTHAHPLAGDVAAAVSVLARALVRGESWEAALARAARGRWPQTCAALVPGANPVGLSSGGYAPDVLQAAVHFVTEGADFSGALEPSLRFAGRANYCPVLVGALAGARWGHSSIPPSALAHCAELGRIRAAALRLEQGW